MAAWGCFFERAAAGQSRLAVPRGPGPQLRNGALHEAGAFWQGYPDYPDSGDPAARAAADPHDVLAGGFAQATVEGRFLRSTGPPILDFSLRACVQTDLPSMCFGDVVGHSTHGSQRRRASGFAPGPQTRGRNR